MCCPRRFSGKQIRHKSLIFLAHPGPRLQLDAKRLLNHLATADVALIKLAEPLPARISPALIAGGGETVAVGDSLVVRRHRARCYPRRYRSARAAADQIV